MQMENVHGGRTWQWLRYMSMSQISLSNIILETKKRSVESAVSMKAIIGPNTGRETTQMKKSLNSNKVVLHLNHGATIGKKSLKPRRMA